MELQDILQEVTKIFTHVLENPGILLKEETTAADIEDWDSLNHIHLVVAIEKRFNVRFTSKELRSFANVGDLCRALLVKGAKP